MICFVCLNGVLRRFQQIFSYITATVIHAPWIPTSTTFFNQELVILTFCYPNNPTSWREDITTIFYGLWYDPAWARTSNLPLPRQRIYQ